MGLIADIAPVDTQERVYIQQIRGRAKNWAGTSKKNTVSFFKEHCGASVPLFLCSVPVLAKFALHTLIYTLPLQGHVPHSVLGSLGPIV